MFMTQPVRTRLAEHAESRPSFHIPMVYEKEQPRRWEYHVLTIDTREAPLPDAEQLNNLGQDGWVMVGLLDERATGKGSHVYYYFARQQ